MRKISTIFSITILFCLIIVVSISSVITTNTSKTAIEKESQERLESTATYAADKIEKELIFFETQIDTLVTSINEHYKSIEGDDKNKVLHILNDYDEIFKKINENNSNTVATYLVFNYQEITYDKDIFYPYQLLYVKDENNISRKDMPLATLKDFKNHSPYMSWFYGPIQNRKGVWSKVYTDEFVDETIISYSAPIIIDGVILAIAGLDIRFENFEKIVSDIEIYDTGYAFLMDDQFNYLVHPIFSNTDNLETVDNGQYAYMINIFRSEINGIIKYDFFNQDKIMAFTRLDNNWIVAAAPPFDEVFYFYNDLKKQQFIYIFSGILISILLATILGHFISRPLTKVAKYIESTDTNELSEIEYGGNKHFIFEVDLLYKNFSNMTQRLNAAFKDIQHHNKNLEILVDSRTVDLNITNTQLKHYIEEIESSQALVLNAKLDSEINVLIKNIAHNLNTPLGNAITTYSYLKKQVTIEEPPINVKLSLNIVEDCLNIMKNIIDSLNILTMDFNQLKTSKLPLKTLFDSRFNLIKSQNSHIDIQYDLSIKEDASINTNKNMLIRLVDTLILYCMMNNETINKICYKICVLENDEGYLIRFQDDRTLYSAISPNFYNNDFKQINLSNFDINLHLLHVIINRGLSGDIKLIESETALLQWQIIIPNK